jgi:hypothetical protein
VLGLEWGEASKIMHPYSGARANIKIKAVQRDLRSVTEDLSSDRNLCNYGGGFSSPAITPTKKCFAAGLVCGLESSWHRSQKAS